LTPARVYLRRQCQLPPNIDLQQNSVDEDWNAVADISGWDLNDRVLEQGWHCIWVSGQYSRVGIGRSPETAASKAVLATLHAVPPSWNAAEIDSISIASYMAFSVAKVTIHARQIQKDHILVSGRVRGKAMHASEKVSQ
jgi:hypothetical protein